MERVLLSICMPTYNFGRFIGQTLDGVLPQLTSAIEVVILDGGSTDNTEEIVRRYQERCPAVRYYKQPHRGGIDRDMARSIELAQGEYCWLFSSDDLMRPNIIRKVLEEIKGGHDLYLCGLTLCTYEMKPIADHRILNLKSATVFELSNPDERQRYFGLAETTTAFFSFMGSLIIKRTKWMSVPLEEKYIGSLWAHVVRILRMIPNGLTVKYIPESFLLKRGGNDSFMDRGLVNRFAMAIDGYHRIANDVFGETSREAYHIRRVITNEFPAKALAVAKLECKKAGLVADRNELDRLATKVFKDPGFRNRFYHFVYRYAPLWAYPVIRFVYRLIKPLLSISTRGR